MGGMEECWDGLVGGKLFGVGGFRGGEDGVDFGGGLDLDCECED